MKALHDEVVLSLLRHNFIVKSIRGCCDIIARRNHRLLLIKVLEDANALTVATSRELRSTAAALQASPLVIAARATKTLQDGVVYTRHAIPVINILTFSLCLSDTPLFMMSKSSGIIAEIHGKKLRELRERNEVSLGRLSNALGVSKRMVVKYESGDAEISLQRAMKMVRILGEEVFKTVDIFASAHEASAPPSSIISTQYQKLGFTVTETRKVPFDIVAKNEAALILTSVGDKIYPDLSNISHAIGASDLAIVSRKKPKDIPALTREEFLEFDKAAELIRFIQEHQ